MRRDEGEDDNNSDEDRIWKVTMAMTTVDTGD
jgi:hypothetical protein